MKGKKTKLSRKLILLATGLLLAAFGAQMTHAQDADQTEFRRIPIQFIAALGDPEATRGSGAQSWGIWRVDPGPRGVWLSDYEKLKEAGGIAPYQWEFDSADWWLEENGLIMEKPDFPVPAGKYIVTGGREVRTMLTIHPTDQDGDQRWELAEGTLFDVTHLPCRSARYTPIEGNESCSPINAPKNAFRVTPGASMPAVEGCNKQDYAVLFVIAEAVDN